MKKSGQSVMNDGKSGLKSRFLDRGYKNVRSVLDGREKTVIANRCIGFRATTATGEAFRTRKCTDFGGEKIGLGLQKDARIKMQLGTL